MIFFPFPQPVHRMHHIYVLTMTSGTFNQFTNTCWMGTLMNCFQDMVKHHLVKIL